MSQIVQCQKCDKKTECRNYLEMAILCEKCIKSIEDKYAVKKAKENLAKSKKLSKSTKSEDKNAGKKLEAKTKRSFKKKMNKSKEIKEKKERTTFFVVGTSAKVKAKTKKVQARKTRYANRQNNLDKKKAKVESRIKKAEARIQMYRDKLISLEQRKLSYNDKINAVDNTPIVVCGNNLVNIEKSSKKKVSHFGIDGQGIMLVKVDGKWYQGSTHLINEDMKLIQRGGKIKEKKSRKSIMKKVIE